MSLTRKHLAGLLSAITGAPANPATSEAGMARLGRLLAGHGIDLDRPDAAAVLVSYADGERTAAGAWTALKAMAPTKTNEPVIPASPVLTNGHSAEEQAAIDAALAAKPGKADRIKAARGRLATKKAADKAQATAAAKAKTDAQQYRLPAPGTKYRIAIDLMRRPGGATNKEICAATGIDASWAVDGRRWGERYGLTFMNCPEKGDKGQRLARFTLTGTLPGEAAAA